MAKVTFVSMWHAIAPASMELLRDELVALCQKEEKLEFWFHACHRDTSKWLLREITELKSHTQTPIEIVDVVDRLKADWCIREPEEQLRHDGFETEAYVRIVYAPGVGSKIPYESKQFISRANQVDRWVIDQCDYLLAYYYDGTLNGATNLVRHGMRNPRVNVIPVADPATVSQIEKLIGELDGRQKLIVDGIREGRSHRSIGDELNISGNRVAQIATKVNGKIMRAIHGPEWW